jgi:hypothetical protein
MSALVAYVSWARPRPINRAYKSSIGGTPAGLENFGAGTGRVDLNNMKSEHYPPRSVAARRRRMLG